VIRLTFDEQASIVRRSLWLRVARIVVVEAAERRRRVIRCVIADAQEVKRREKSVLM